MQYFSLQYHTLLPSSVISTTGCCFCFGCICSFFLEFFSALISSSMSGTYWPGEFIFQCPIILPFHTVHGVLKAMILMWFAIPFSSGPHFVRTLHLDPCRMGPVNFQMFKLDLEKAEEPEIQLWTSAGSSKKQESSRKTSTSALLTIAKPLTVWITTNCGKFFKRREYQTTWPASWEICMQVKEQQLELEMEQQTGSKLGKEYVKAVYCHPVYLTYMQSTLFKIPGWMKHRLESRLPGEISITSDMQMTPPLWHKVKKN